MIQKRVNRNITFAFLGLIVIGMLAFVSATDIPSSEAKWENYYETDITGELLVFEIDDFLPGPISLEDPRNTFMIVENVGDAPPYEDYVEYALYEKDTHEGNEDDLIRFPIVGSYDRLTDEASGQWTITLADLALSNEDYQEADGIHEFYFGVSIGPCRDGSTCSGTYSSKILNVKLESMINPLPGGPSTHWLDSQFDLIDYLYTVKGEDLSNVASNASNLVYPVLEGLSIPLGSQNETPVLFEIWAEGCSQIPIRTEQDAILVYASPGDTSVMAPWYISLNDILKAPLHTSIDGAGDPIDYYKFFSNALYGDQGVCFEDSYLYVTIDWEGVTNSTNPEDNFTEKWLDYETSVEIRNISLAVSDLGSDPEANVSLELTGFPSAFNSVSNNGEEIEIYFEIYELDDLENNVFASHLGLDVDDGTGEDDPVRTYELGNHLIGTVDEFGNVKVPWTITENDILSSEEEKEYEYQFNVGIIGEKGAVPLNTQGKNLLILDLDGDLQGCAVSGASGEWMFLSGSIYTSSPSNVLFFPDAGNLTMKTFSYNLPCDEGTPVQIEIYEFDQGSDHDEIRTTGQGNHLTGIVNSNGQIFPSWTMTQEDLDAGMEGDSDGVYEFFFKIIVGQGEKDFSDELLYVEASSSICPTVNYCSDYIDGLECNLDSCTVASATGLDLFQIDCALPGITCACLWDNVTENCEFASGYGIGGDEGLCIFTDAGTDTCEEDGFLSYTWFAELIWGSNSYTSAECVAYAISVGGSFSDCVEDEVGSGNWHYDPDGLYAKCVGGSDKILCPAKVQLSFWDWRNVVIVILLLIIIYFVVDLNKNRAKKRKVKNKK